eukprot:5220794-Pyramimonas_sp.AAC.1
MLAKLFKYDRDHGAEDASDEAEPGDEVRRGEPPWRESPRRMKTNEGGNVGDARSSEWPGQ